MNPIPPAEMLRRSVAAIADSSPLPKLIEWWFEKTISSEQSALCAAGVSDAEAHRARGRLGMAIELRDEWLALQEAAKRGIEGGNG